MIRVGIVGYGNLGRGVEVALENSPDLKLIAVFTRRNPDNIQIINKSAKVESLDSLLNYLDKIDVMILCGGSATDLPLQTPAIAKYFNVVDSFDTHKLINIHFDNVDKVAKNSQKSAIVSIGWDPGLFSVNRLYSTAILPNSKINTFWGDGVSQGHSDAIRKINGVLYATQYTRPIKAVVAEVSKGQSLDLPATEKHLRDCYVVIKEGYSQDEVARQIKEMPNYFVGYQTIVNFITREEYLKKHTKMPHGGKVLTAGKTGHNQHLIEYSLNLDSNPEFTASVLVAYARACYRLYQDQNYGCKTIFDVPPAYLSNKAPEELRKELL